jgi:hypothetical protein
MMKKVLVSRGLWGPMKDSHQPGAVFRGVDAACEDAERPVCKSITLSLLGERVPQVS